MHLLPYALSLLCNTSFSVSAVQIIVLFREHIYVEHMYSFFYLLLVESTSTDPMGIDSQVYLHTQAKIIVL